MKSKQDKQITEEEQEQTDTGRDIIKEGKEQAQMLNNYGGDSIKLRPKF